jgi:restriction endonuclease S subunit
MSNEKTEQYQVPIYSNGIGENALYGFTDKIRVNEEAVTISARGTIGYSEIRQAPFFPIVRLIVAIPNTTKILAKYLQIAITKLDIVSSGNSIQQLTVPMIKNYQIPVPPLSVQQEIVAEIEGYEAKIAECRSVMEMAQKRKVEILRKFLS